MPLLLRPQRNPQKPRGFCQFKVQGGQVLGKARKDAALHQAAETTDPILLSFTCDPYQHLDCELRTTRKTIAILKKHGLKIQVLTKGGQRALRDLDLFDPRDTFATTLTFLDDDRSRQWEPNAALPFSRIDAVKKFHAEDIATWVSLEPVLDPATSLEIIRQTHTFVDIYKVGKLNHHARAKEINWQQFAGDAIELLKNLDYQRNTDHDGLEIGQFYIKEDLAAYL